MSRSTREVFKLLKQSPAVFQILGFYYPNSRHSDNKNFNILIKYFLYTLQILFLIFFMWCITITAFKLIWLPDFNNTTTKQIVDMLSMLAMLLHLIIRNISYLNQKNATIKLLQLNENISSSIDKNFEKSYGILYGILLYSIAVTLSICYLFKFQFRNMQVIALYILGYVVDTIEMYFIYKILNDIRQNFERNNNRLIFIYTLINNKTRSTTEILCNIIKVIKLYNELCHTARLANEIFEIPLVTLCICTIMKSVNLMYFTIFAIIHILENGVDNSSLLIFVLLVPFFFIHSVFIIKPWISTSIEVNTNINHYFIC